MSALGYLEDRAKNAILSTEEELSITRSISTIKSRLNVYFDGELQEQLRFGSSTRGTILPRKSDPQSDIDYMIVFKDSSLNPQTYLDKLKRFSDYHYASSDIKQSSPSIVLEMGHINFDLVPAIKTYSSYKIIDQNKFWQETSPNDFNKKLSDKNTAELSRIKPLIRLIKIWNAHNGYVFNSFSLEQWVVNQNYFLCLNLKDYLLKLIDLLPTSTQTQWRDRKIQRAKEIVAEFRFYDKNDCPLLAEREIKKLIPE